MAEPAPAAPRGRRRLGEILVESGRLSEEQIERALTMQRGSGRRLGEVLLDEGLVQPIDLLRALAVQFELDFVDLDEVQMDPTLLAQIPDALARRHRSIPLYRDDDRVVVAMANPADVFAIDDLRTLLRSDIHPVMADSGQILDALGRTKQGDEHVQQAIRMALATATVDEEPQQAKVTRNADRAAAEDDAPIVRFVDLLIARAVQERASDIHIEPTAADLRVRYRIDGVLHESLRPPRTLQAGILSRIKVMADIDIAERRLPQDGRVSLTVGGRPIDLRVATVPTVYGEAAVLRILRRDGDYTQLSDLGMLPEMQTEFERTYKVPWGAVFVTGPTGSGKTTTLYSVLRDINSPTRNLITVEDPVEYRLNGVKQVQVNNKAGLTFANALRNFLRADPDVILVGEIRDRETATIAIEASLTGHLVLSSLHTNDSVSTPMRLLEMGVEPFLVTSSLKGVLAQRLARRLCERCRVPVHLTPSEAEVAKVPAPLLAEDGTFSCYRAGGCPSCANSGYKGRFGIHEVLVVDDDLSKLILDRASTAVLAQSAVDKGMVTMRMDGLRKVALGWTSLEELLRVLG